MVWRTEFVEALRAVAKAAERLPVGVADPVLSGAAAVELYSGGLWPTAELEVTGSNPQKLTTELFAFGFRWCERPNGAGRRLWHPGLGVGISIFPGEGFPGSAERANLLTIVLDPAETDTAKYEAPRLQVVGIEDTIVRIACERPPYRGSSPRPSAKLRVLTSLAMTGIGGALRIEYLHRRLASETQGELTFESPSTDASDLFERSPRVVALNEMAALIRDWRGRNGWCLDVTPEWRRSNGCKPVTWPQRAAERRGVFQSNVVPFDRRRAPRATEEIH